jgi:hypothetical protein
VALLKYQLTKSAKAINSLGLLAKTVNVEPEKLSTVPEVVVENQDQYLIN